MSYIGREPQIGNFQVCDDITVVNGQAAYTMQVGGVNVLPETANHCLVSLNGVLQKSSGTSPSFTISGSTITFASNLVTGDVINFIHILGSVLDLGVPSDSTVSLAKLTATGTKNSSTFLRGDNSFAVPSGGKIGQVVSTQKTDIFSTTNGILGSGFTDITGLSVSITPSATSSKILILASIMCSDSSPNRVYFRLQRGGAVIGNPAAVSSGTPCIASSFQSSSNTFTDSVGVNYLDSPNSTSAQTYKFTTCHNQSDGNSTVRINGQGNSGNGASDDNTTSTITVMEILA